MSFARDKPTNGKAKGVGMKIHEQYADYVDISIPMLHSFLERFGIENEFTDEELLKWVKASNILKQKDRDSVFNTKLPVLNAGTANFFVNKINESAIKNCCLIEVKRSPSSKKSRCMLLAESLIDATYHSFMRLFSQEWSISFSEIDKKLDAVLENKNIESTIRSQFDSIRKILLDSRYEGFQKLMNITDKQLREHLSKIKKSNPDIICYGQPMPFKKKVAIQAIKKHIKKIDHLYFPHGPSGKIVYDIDEEGFSGPMNIPEHVVPVSFSKNLYNQFKTRINKANVSIEKGSDNDLLGHAEYVISKYHHGHHLEPESFLALIRAGCSPDTLYLIPPDFECEDFLDFIEGAIGENCSFLEWDEHEAEDLKILLDFLGETEQ
jgi:hypothetical protein